MVSAQNSKVLCLVGPTGTGKSSVALQIAENTEAEIVNCDSRQVYADFPCITAQPSDQDQAGCPHHLYGFLPTDQAMDAGRFVTLAQKVIHDMQARGKLPVLVGGTGLYIRALIYGLAPIPDIPRAIHTRIQTQCREQGPEELHRRLQATDPETADRLHPRDRQRITRALEVQAATQRPLSWWIRRYPCDQPRYDVLTIGLWSDLESLTPLLQERIERMWAQGALQEAARAWQRCPQENAPGWSGIGCWELLQVLLERWSVAEAKQEWLKNTRAYAKRQLTWFKKESGIRWFNTGQTASITEIVLSWLQR
ncbi:MAG: tRNA (adenosine(37)-N6)-dimethylallyltransferase MiaA [Desulfovermiculus sp.]|nr:tRNA (adenosine(37)-N6)-dimethylallyltransferase MiaA [Desulfovermiculus sp.]